ncbi:arylesterase [Pseudovibrio exalbescens]|uniref:arylesterase n=1 Tax=Pseudovibrio exalbescens TaxID=197461 RepID=UPI003CC7F72E
MRSRNVFLQLVALMALCVASTISAKAEDTIKLVAFGDSLTAGYLLAPEDAFPVQLEKALRAKGHDVTIVNAGVSGDTTSGGLSRLDWSVGEDVQGVILELGANDALRGLDPATTRANMDEMVRRLTERGVKVLVAGMLAPRNLGEEYAELYDPIFPEISQKYEALYYPFFLEGVAANPMLNLADGLHPTGEGVAVIVENILPSVEKLIDQIKAERASAE